MIINYLKGGIGNQIFQHALAKSLSLRLNRELFTEISYYQHDPYGFKSKIQNIDPDIKFINLRDIDKTGAYLLKEGQISELNEIKHLPDSIKILILEGYWQGEEYFDKKIAIDFIENIKKYSTNLKNNNEIANKINTSDSPIALHIRRRDYGHMGLCKTSYYSAAIDFLKSLNSNSELFVFSDEPNYTRHLLESRNLSFTLIDTGDDLVDLYLMSRCKNFVISNSSYSWWGAWFGETNSQNNSIVISPKEWVTINNAKTPCPERWNQIPNAIDKFSIDLADSTKMLEYLKMKN